MSEVHNLTWRAMPVALLTSDHRVLDLDWRDRGVLSALFAVCDDYGRFSAHARQLSLQIGWTDGPTKLKNIIGRFVSLGFVRLYQAGGRALGEVVGYCGLVPRQRERQAHYPAPPGGDGSVDPLPHPLATPPANPLSNPLSNPLATEERRKKKEERKAGQQASKDSGHIHARAREGVAMPPVAPPDTPPALPPVAPVAVTPSVTPCPTPVASTLPEKGLDRVQAMVDGASVESGPVSDSVKKLIGRWNERLMREQPTMLIRDEQFELLVDEFGEEVFVEAMRRHLQEPAGAKFWSRFPMQGLRKRCEWAAAEQRPVVAPVRAAPPSLEEQASAKRYLDAWRAAHTAALRSQTWGRVMADLEGGRVSLSQVQAWVRPLGVELSRDRSVLTLHAPDESHGLVIGDHAWPLRSALFDAIDRAFGPVHVRCVTDAGELELWTHGAFVGHASHGGQMVAGAA
jgi:hypothetical protein